MKRKITVIVPWYNDNYLMEAIGTVLNQRRTFDELIVINDGSTENLEDWFLLENMAAVDDRIRLLRLPENKGIGYVRQKGIEMAQGDWVAFLSSDDKWRPNFLKEMELVMDRFPEIDVIYSNYYRIDSEGNIINIHRETHLTEMADFKVHLFKRCCVNLSAAVFRAEPLKKVGFDITLKYGEDYLTLLKLARDYTFKHIEMILAKYRVHKGQHTNKYLKEITKNDGRILEEARRYYEKKYNVPLCTAEEFI